MLSTVGPISPVLSEGGGSWVWAVVAVGMVLAFLALTWLAGLWGRRSRGTQETRGMSSHHEKKAA